MTMPADDTEVLVVIARMEGKLDLTLAEIATLRERDSDHETRLRSIEQQPIPDPETEKRIRALENRSTVSLAQLWVGLVGVAGFIATSIAIINGLVGLMGLK